MGGSLSHKSIFAGDALYTDTEPLIQIREVKINGALDSLKVLGKGQ